MLSFNWENTSVQIYTLNIVFGSALTGLHLIYFFSHRFGLKCVHYSGWKSKESNKNKTKKSNTKKHPKVLKGGEEFAETENLEASHLGCQVINLAVSWKPAQHSFCYTKSVDLTLQSSCSAAVRSSLFLPKCSYSSVGACFDRRQGPNSEFLLAPFWNKWDIHTSSLFLDLWKQVEISYSCHTFQGFCAVRRPC